MSDTTSKNASMQLDHISFAAGPDGLAETTARLSAQLGAEFLDGGVHPRFGTRNAILPLAGNQYLEVVECLDHPASDKMAFGQLVKQVSSAGGGWMGWTVAVDDITPVEERLGRKAVPGNRRRPDGYQLEWLQIGTSDKIRDPQLPAVTQWLSQSEEHPSLMAETGVRLTALDIAGSDQVLADWFGEPAVTALGGIEVRWIAPNGAPGILAAEFATESGSVRL